MNGGLQMEWALLSLKKKSNIFDLMVINRMHIDSLSTWNVLLDHISTDKTFAVLPVGRGVEHNIVHLHMTRERERERERELEKRSAVGFAL